MGIAKFKTAEMTFSLTQGNKFLAPSIELLGKKNRLSAARIADISN